MQYTVLENSHLEDHNKDDPGLLTEVNNLIEEGWIPQGGVSMKQSRSWVTSANSGQHYVYTKYIQAMIKD